MTSTLQVLMPDLLHALQIQFMLLAAGMQFCMIHMCDSTNEAVVMSNGTLDI